MAYEPKDDTLESRIEKLYGHYSDMGCDISKAVKANPTDIAYYFACECFCEGWGLDNGEKAKYPEVIKCGIATVCIRHRFVLDVEKFKEDDYIGACRDAVDKVLNMYYYRRVFA